MFETPFDSVFEILGARGNYVELAGLAKRALEEKESDIESYIERIEEDSV